MNLYKNRNIVIIGVDKENVTVVTNRTKYVRKMNTLLNPQHYRKLNKVQTITVKQHTRKHVKYSSIPNEEQS